MCTSRCRCSPAAPTPTRRLSTTCAVFAVAVCTDKHTNTHFCRGSRTSTSTWHVTLCLENQISSFPWIEAPLLSVSSAVARPVRAAAQTHTVCLSASFIRPLSSPSRLFTITSVPYGWRAGPSAFDLWGFLECKVHLVVLRICEATKIRWKEKGRNVVYRVTRSSPMECFTSFCRCIVELPQSCDWFVWLSGCGVPASMLAWVGVSVGLSSSIVFASFYSAFILTPSPLFPASPFLCRYTHPAFVIGPAHLFLLWTHCSSLSTSFA